MTNLITLTIPNDDHIALRAFGKALEEMALAHGAEPRKTTAGELSYKLNIDTTDATAALERLNTAVEELQPEVDTTVQQVESLTVPGTTHVMTEQTLVGEPVPVGDGNFSQGYIATVGEIADPVDSTGTPWDERIHSASKALNSDGTWRLRRKPKDIDEEEWAALVESVKCELQHGDEIREALDKAERGEAVYYTSEEAEQKMEEFKESKQAILEPQYNAVQKPININYVSIDPAPDEGDETVEPPVTHQNPAYMYQKSRNVYALGRSEEEIAEYETKGYVRHTQEQYDAWEGPTVADEGDDFHTDEQTVAGIPPIPVPPPVVVAPPVPEVTEWDFPRLMTFLTERHGKIDVVTVNTLLAQDGMLSVQELNAHPDKIGPFVARVKAHLGE